MLATVAQPVYLQKGSVVWCYSGVPKVNIGVITVLLRWRFRVLEGGEGKVKGNCVVVLCCFVGVGLCSAAIVLPSCYRGVVRCFRKSRTQRR
jgi:hypothetical protein